ncbi:MAG: hypothetical protein NT166_29120 [Candidatus Aminicenantes bacterium]|nr:hypothetical protein [Candidatus Aminicenantes bacterium]
MNKAKIFLMILIVGTMTQYAFSEDENVFHRGGVIISAEYQSILPSCNSYPHLKYPQGVFEYCIWKNVSLAMGVGYGSRNRGGYLRKENELSLESSIFQNFRISGNSVKGIMGIGLVWIPNLKTVSIKPTFGIRFLIARKVAIHAKIFYLKTSDMDIGLGFAYGLGFALK